MSVMTRHNKAKRRIMLAISRTELMFKIEEVSQTDYKRKIKQPSIKIVKGRELEL